MGWGIPEAGQQCYNSPMNSDLSGTRTTTRPRAKMPFLGRTLGRGPTIKSHALQRKTNCCNCTDSKIERISSWGPVVHLSSQFVSVFSFQITLSKIKLTITLDHVYCAWLIKSVVKREIIQLTELCLARWWIISGTWWYWVTIWRYWLVLGISWYCLVLGGTWSAKGLYACIYRKEWSFGWMLPMPHTHTHSQTTEYRATQLV